MKTIKKACSIPATPTIHDKRINRITPKMFWIVGRYTPISVPILAGYSKKVKHKNY